MSEVQICNRALTKIGSARIISLDDDVKSARALVSCYADIRDDELRARRWQFAMRRVSLPALATAPVFGYTYQYQVPSDFLRVDMVDDRFPPPNTGAYIQDEDLLWLLEGNVILTNISAPLKVRYIARVTDTTMFDPSFREALACRLAAEICEEISPSNSKREMAWKEYHQAIAGAVRSSAVERIPVTMPDDSWVMSRL